MYGVRQGDTFSITLFRLFLNDLGLHLKETGPVLKIYGLEINCLLYADDMVFIAESEENLQRLLQAIYDWCNKWCLKVNESKSQIFYFRTSRQNCTNFNFMYGDQEL